MSRKMERSSGARLTIEATTPASVESTAADIRRLVLEILGDRSPPSGASIFRLRRAHAMTTGLPTPAERDAVTGILFVLDAQEGAHDQLLDALLCWAGELEARGLIDESRDVVQLSLRLRPADAHTMLHAARLARKAERREEACALYDRVAELHPEAQLGLMAVIGRALLSTAPEGQLGEVLRSAIKAGDTEAAGVAQHERARARRARGDIPGALRDYVTAGARYPDPIDRGLVGHEVADMLIMRGDLEGAREALLEVTRCGHPEQAAHARTRLHGIARAQGDELGLRRFADVAPPKLVSLSPPARRRPRERFAERGLRGLSRIRTSSLP